MKYIAGAIAFILLLILVIISLDKKEIAECMQWKEYAHDLPSFYLVEWQKAQCEAHGIIIN